VNSIDDRPVFLALAALVPAELREWPLGAWDIGEQEAALAALVEAIIDSGTMTSDSDRAQITALARRWDCWESLQDALAKCPRAARAPEISEDAPEEP
jgi:hypothetical protein